MLVNSRSAGVHTANGFIEKIIRRIIMNNKIKRSIAVTLTAAAICNPLSISNSFSVPFANTTTASAADAGQEIKSGTWSRYDGTYYDQYEDVSFNLKMTEKGIVITGCYTRKANTTIRIPKQLYGRDVVAVGDYAFEGQKNITSVMFYGINEPIYTTLYHQGGTSFGPTYFKGASAISEIGESAFEGCSNLKSVTVGNKELTVGDYAFYECNNLGYIQFTNASGANIAPVYGNIGDSAFFKTNLQSLGDHSWTVRCKNIGDFAFDRCDNLEQVNIIAENIGRYSFGSDKKLKSAIIDSPEVGEYSFYKCSALDDVKLLNTKRIGNHAFDSCVELKTISIPNSIESIGEFAFCYDSKLCTPALFVKAPGQRLCIGRFAYYGTAVEYAAFSGNIAINDYAFRNSKLKKAVVEGNVSINSYALGFDGNTRNPGFTIYGNANSNSYASSYGIPYVKVDKNKAVNNLMNEVKPYFMGIDAGKFGNDNGCCAGVALAQMLTYTNRLSFAELFPVKYNGKQITRFLDVPNDAYTANRPEFKKFTTDVYNYWKDQNYYLFYNKHTGYEINFTPDTIEGYSKLTEYGIVLPGVVRVKNHNHSVASFGIEKLKTPIKITDDISHTEKTYEYRILVSENGYRFKEQNGRLVAKGSDHFTWWPGCREEEGWTDIDNTYIYVTASGDCYQQRWDKGQNVKSNAKLSTLADFDFLLASNIGSGK